MLTIVTLLSMFVGYEGYDNGKIYFGIYTQDREYGYVITESEIYLDTVYEKRQGLYSPIRQDHQCITVSEKRVKFQLTE